MARDRKKGREAVAVPVELTAAEIAEAKKAKKKVEKKALKAKKKTALLNILKFVAEQDDHGLTAEILLVTPGFRAGGGGSSILDTFKELFTEQEEVKGLKIYQEHGIGQGEMRKIVRNLIKKLSPVKRIWVHYDKASDTYTVMGTGVEVPEGWTGYRPVEVDDVEII